MSTARHADGSVDANAGEALDADVAPLLATPASTRNRRLDFGLGHDVARRSFEHGDPALLERLRTLRTILPAMATEVAIARREGARLRRENAKLRDLLTRVQGSLPAGMLAAGSASRGEAR